MVKISHPYTSVQDGCGLPKDFYTIGKTIGINGNANGTTGSPNGTIDTPNGTIGKPRTEPVLA